MSKVLTVVIPSYNVEAYLADTLESFISEEKERKEQPDEA